MSDPVAATVLISGGTWAGMVGVEGGIPTNFTLSTTVSDSGNSATNRSNINTAITNAANDTYVLLDSGTYQVNNTILLSNSRTILRGAVDAQGLPATTINFTAGSDRLLRIGAESGWDISNTGSFTTRNVTDPTGASLRGASTVTLASAPTGMTVNQPIFFSDDSQGGDDFYGFGSSGAGRTWMHWARVSAISGSDITFSPPISADYLTGTLQCHFKAGGSMVSRCGLENIIVTSSSVDTSLTGFYGADECWIKNCKIGPTTGNSQRHHVDCYSFFRCQIDHSELYGQETYGNSSYVINAYAGGSFLVVNTYIHDVANIMPMFGLHSSAFAYNYCNAFSYDSPTHWLSQIVFDHGAIQDYNLYEGNRVAASYNDNSATARNTLWFRNRMRGYDADGATGVTTGNTNCLTQEDGYSIRVMAGNVLGENGIHSTVTRTFTTGNENSTDNIYNLNTDHDDLVTRIANYNTVDDAIPAGEALGGGEALVTSYLYAAKPSWFGICPWPPIDPTLFTQSNTVTSLPAGYRATNGTDPPAAAASVGFIRGILAR